MASQDVMNFVNFNQDFSCISVGSRNGYKIYNCDPFGKCFAKPDGGIGIVEMLFCTSLVAVVGIGDQAALSPRRLKIMNTKRQSTICELTFPTAVLKVKLNRKRLIVVLEEQIYIYDISNMKLLHTIETAPNPNAVCSLSPSSDNCYMVYPSAAPISIGSGVGVVGNGGISNNNPSTSPNRTGELKIFDCINLQPINVIEAHKGPLSIVTLNNDGTLLATASEKGTIIRIFSIPSGNKLYQFRRGTYPSKIFSINFNLSSSLLCVSSSTETVHIFKLTRNGGRSLVPEGVQSHNIPGVRNGGSNSGNGKEVSRSIDSTDGDNSNSSASIVTDDSYTSPNIPDDDGSDNDNDIDSQTSDRISPPQPTQKSANRFSPAIGFIRNKSITKHVSGYLPSAVTNILEPKTRDFAYFKLPAQAGTKSVVALSNTSNHALVVTSEGYFYQYSIDLENGGECELVKQFSLLDSEDY